MVDDNILLSYGREAVAAKVTDALGKARNIRRELQIGSVVDNELAGRSKPEQPVLQENILGVDIELVDDEGKQVLGHVGVDFKANNRAAAPALQRGLE